jgi:hypothetical protein
MGCNDKKVVGVFVRFFVRRFTKTRPELLHGKKRNYFFGLNLEESGEANH